MCQNLTARVLHQCLQVSWHLGSDLDRRPERCERHIGKRKADASEVPSACIPVKSAAVRANLCNSLPLEQLRARAVLLGPVPMDEVLASVTQQQLRFLKVVTRPAAGKSDSRETIFDGIRAPKVL